MNNPQIAFLGSLSIDHSALRFLKKIKMALGSEKDSKMEVENPPTNQPEDGNRVDPFTLESILTFVLNLYVNISFFE